MPPSRHCHITNSQPTSLKFAAFSIFVFEFLNFDHNLMTDKRPLSYLAFDSIISNLLNYDVNHLSLLICVASDRVSRARRDVVCVLVWLMVCYVKKFRNVIILYIHSFKLRRTYVIH